MEAKITDIEGLKVGTAEDLEALTGCTVVLAEQGAVCGVDVRGSAPGTRETDLLSPLNLVEKVHAVLLAGGSAFGLEAASGIMEYLEERNIGYPTGKTVVPIVPGAVIFDLNVGDYRRRPDKAMGYRACLNAGEIVREGNVGAGTGATVGKALGHEYCTKSGQGSSAVRLEDGLIVGALAVVNAYGDIVDPKTGQVIAGVRDPEGEGFLCTLDIWKGEGQALNQAFAANTTIAVVATNARLDKSQATKVAQMAHDGMARVIVPCHTMYDGDTVFALATGQVEADVNLVGILAQEVLMQAIIRAVVFAETVQGIPAAGVEL
ncbi:P1 family peptidase [Syntrophothermus lipocalidus]|uniref:Peptidase S58 DmpA n=1 Tax=Syntrophothermus lipocalidus (strain DSM 12680 / TGB-C1) TaxID=643648 RepID=D7CJ54_SYNLT|nr:P1 family peptidase [Syntrophothermus lipocalidus]ADI00943.1 peptidase S58 DmpA [Syntrophothermus lipocalidus DSM 12680]